MPRGTIGRRFYAGCQNVDTVEAVAVEHAKALFDAAVCVCPAALRHRRQPGGVLAILADRVEAPSLKRFAKRQVNDLTDAEWPSCGRAGNQRMLGMSLDAGGHLTHGSGRTSPARCSTSAATGVDPASGQIDYAALRETGPRVQAAGDRGRLLRVPPEGEFRKMREIADEVGATFMVDMAHFAGLVAGKVFTGDFNPIEHAHIVTTTTHKSLRGPRGGAVLCQPELSDQVDRGCPMVLGGPLAHVMAAKAIAFAEARRPEFATYAQQIVDNSQALATGLLERGVRLVSGGTDNHLVLIDVHPFGLTGRQAEQALLDSGVVTNRNAIPQDPNGAWLHLRHPHRHAGADQPGPRHARNGPDRRPHPHGSRGDLPGRGLQGQVQPRPGPGRPRSKQATELLAPFPSTPR